MLIYIEIMKMNLDAIMQSSSLSHAWRGRNFPRQKETKRLPSTTIRHIEGSIGVSASRARPNVTSLAETSLKQKQIDLSGAKCLSAEYP